MTLFTSTAPDITEGIPTPLTGGGGRALHFSTDSRFDIMVNGIPFSFRPGNGTPYLRSGGQVRKQQFDTSDEAGEQSLSDWWIRSQTSWHMGAGTKYYEPGAEAETQYRFATSQGVDVWTDGQLTLLHDMSDAVSGLTEPVYLSTHRRDGVDGFVSVAGTALAWRNATGTASPTATLAAGTSTQPATQGAYVWVGHEDRVSRWDTTGAGTLTVPWTCSGDARVWWVKSRLFVAVGPKLYWVDHTLTGPSVVETTGTLVAQHPDPDWVWVDVSETADSILLAGAAASESAVFAVGIDDSVPVPVLTGARQVAQLPAGEQATCMSAYLSTYIVLGTTTGIRVGTLGANGAVQLGPVSVETPVDAVDITFHDRFAYLPVTTALPDGTTGLVRIDLSAQIGDTGLWAWAWDVSTKAALTATSVCKIGTTSRLVEAAGGHIYIESDTDLVASGYLDTGLIRYRTAELKDFQRARLTGTLNGGTVDLSSLLNGDVYRIISYGPATGLEGEAGLNLPGGPLFPAMAFRITLNQVGDVSPEVNGFAVKAMPAVSKSRLIRYPLSCFDYEVLRHGDRVGMDGFAWDRVQEIEALEDAAAAVQIVDTRVNETLVATIESAEFQSASPPDKSLPNAGGILNLTIRIR